VRLRGTRIAVARARIVGLACSTSSEPLRECRKGEI
jgi:hypothetical protein